MRLIAFVAALAASHLLANEAFGQNRPITIVVPYWFGLAVPAATPRAVIGRLNQALNASTSDPKVREALESRGATIVQHTPEDAYAFVKNEVQKWEPVVKRAGVVPD